MMRGLRGATTVNENSEQEILEHTKRLIEEMVHVNDVTPSMISHVFISVTDDINAVFPAKALRLIHGWTYVPVMCMREIDVPNSLEKCIRVMMVVHTNKNQDEIKHIFHNDAIKLRPDLIDKKEG
ncbi:MAG TPA: chorismate mutase [Virgibacillus sp.]|nr:chorismate mutase [Virgibacillus sp.]